MTTELTHEGWQSERPTSFFSCLGMNIFNLEACWLQPGRIFDLQQALPRPWTVKQTGSRLVLLSLPGRFTGLATIDFRRGWKHLQEIWQQVGFFFFFLLNITEQFGFRNIKRANAASCSLGASVSKQGWERIRWTPTTAYFRSTSCADYPGNNKKQNTDSFSGSNKSDNCNYKIGNKLANKMLYLFKHISITNS